MGLNPQTVSTTSETRMPGRATFKGMDYQMTGKGEKVITIEAITYPMVTGGLDCLGWLIKHHDAQDAVNYIRLGKNYLGSVQGLYGVRNLDYDEDHIHPFTGVGRKVEVSFELLDLGGSASLQQVVGSLFGQVLR